MYINIVVLCGIIGYIKGQTATSTTTSTTANKLYNYLKSGNDWTGTCSTGQAQSPVDIQIIKGTCDNLMVLDIQMDEGDQTVQIQRTAQTIMSNAKVGNLYATDVSGNLYGYSASYFQFKSPSEHSISGTFYDFEMQIVHTIKPEFKSASSSDYAILSILFSQSSTAQPFFDTYQLNAASGTNFKINFNTLLGSQLSTNPVYYTYQGSLTAPPCTENVNWYILDKSLPITQTQLNSFNQFFSQNATFANGNGNNRAEQGANGRTIKQGGVVCEEQFVYFFSFFILYIFINYFIFKLL